MTGPKVPKKKRTISPRGRRQKGAQFERDIASELKSLFPGAKRGIGQARSSSEVADVDGIEHFWVECKRRSTPVEIKKAMEQAIKAKGSLDRMPLVVSKEDNEKALATLLWSDFLVILSDWLRLKRGTENEQRRENRDDRRTPPPRVEGPRDRGDAHREGGGGRFRLRPKRG